jgi:hypothetical protein
MLEWGLRLHQSLRLCQAGKVIAGGENCLLWVLECWKRASLIQIPLTLLNYLAQQTKGNIFLLSFSNLRNGMVPIPIF